MNKCNVVNKKKERFSAVDKLMCLMAKKSYLLDYSFECNRFKFLFFKLQVNTQLTLLPAHFKHWFNLFIYNFYLFALMSLTTIIFLLFKNYISFFKLNFKHLMCFLLFFIFAFSSPVSCHFPTTVFYFKSGRSLKLMLSECALPFSTNFDVCRLSMLLYYLLTLPFFCY